MQTCSFVTVLQRDNNPDSPHEGELRLGVAIAAVGVTCYYALRLPAPWWLLLPATSFPLV